LIGRFHRQKMAETDPTTDAPAAGAPDKPAYITQIKSCLSALRLSSVSSR
jgi:hypothetical protein